MNIESLTIDQFQRIHAILESRVFSLYEKKLGVVAVVKNIPIEAVKILLAKDLNDHYSQIEKQLQKLPELKARHSIKVNGKRYKLNLYADTLMTGQLIDLLSMDLKTESSCIENMHRVLATIASDVNFFGKARYNVKDHSQRAEDFKQHATFGDVWGAVAFFLNGSGHYSSLFLTSSMVQATTTQTTDKV